MKQRIPFSIEHRKEIESGEYKVFTNYGLPVEIVKWDCQSHAPILAYIDKGRGQDSHFYCEDGSCYDGKGDEDNLHIEVESYTRKEALELAVETITKDVKSAKKFLLDAGIMDENGELAEQYRGPDYKTTKDDSDAYENSCNESLRSKIKRCIFEAIEDKTQSSIYPSVERAASQILKIFGIKDTDKEFT